jgi:hypothetical protein
MNSYYVWILIFFAVIMYEFVYFLQKLRARASRERVLRARSTSREGEAQAHLLPRPGRARSLYIRSYSSIIKSRYIESDQNIQIGFYMQHRSDFIWLSHHVISDSVFLNGQQIHSEWKTKKKLTETKTHRSDSTWFLHHLDPILRSDFSCRSESMEKPILAVTDPIYFHNNYLCKQK